LTRDSLRVKEQARAQLFLFDIFVYGLPRINASHIPDYELEWAVSPSLSIKVK